MRFPVTGSVKFLTVATQTSAGGTNATSARHPSQRVPEAGIQVRSFMFLIFHLLFLFRL